ncbi:MAG: radical SAM protein [Nitrospiraceae bacterium]|nr:radical SAM protein [Nitrospiraceae bacterium]
MKNNSNKQNLGHIKIPLKRVHIELTNVCDFNCVFCPKSEMKRPYGYMETEFAKNIISELASNNICEKITFHVMGEPTLHRDFLKILSHAQNQKMKVGLTTNGSSLSKVTGEKLQEYNLYQIDISLQTPDEQSFALRKAGNITFENYLNGIFSFFNEYHKKNSGTIFKFRFLNTRFRNKHMEKKTGSLKVMSSTRELRDTFNYWAGKIYDSLGIARDKKEKFLERIENLVSYKWNVVEIYPNVFFETYVLDDWGHAFSDTKIHDAWGGYCFGMRDHFAILHNGDVTLCCMDFDGRTAIGNLHKSSLKEILSSVRLGEIMKGFKKFRFVHPYCKRCMGSRTFTSWLFKPIIAVAGLNILKPFFYKHTKIYS